MNTLSKSLVVTMLFITHLSKPHVQEQTPIKKHIGIETIHTLCKSIHAQITHDTDASFKPDLIIGLSRGGLIPLGFLAGEQMFNNRNVRILSVTSYSDEKQQSGLKLIFPLFEEELAYLQQFKSVLVVDDLVDSGKSLNWATKVLHEALPQATIKTAVLFYKKSSIVMPDYYAAQADEWLVFPWEK